MELINAVELSKLTKKDNAEAKKEALCSLIQKIDRARRIGKTYTYITGYNHVKEQLRDAGYWATHQITCCRCKRPACWVNGSLIPPGCGNLDDSDDSSFNMWCYHCDDNNKNPYNPDNFMEGGFVKWRDGTCADKDVDCAFCDNKISMTHEFYAKCSCDSNCDCYAHLKCFTKASSADKVELAKCKCNKSCRLSLREWEESYSHGTLLS